MNDLLQKLTGDQALEVVRRLAERKGPISEAVAVTAAQVLAAVHIDEIADDVCFALETIDVEDCCHRAGPRRDGYTSPDEAATELVEETLQPFVEQAERYHELGMGEQERDYCMGVVLGTYRYVHESDSEFKDWCEDIPVECAGDLLDTWRKRAGDPSSHATMNAFIQQRCSAWARYFVRAGDQTR